jgi:hypothetical protein
VFPDLFAFTPAFLGLFWLLATGQMSFGDWPGRHGINEPAGGGASALQLAGYLYNFSHSIFVFALVFGIIWLVQNRLARRRHKQ